MGEKNKETNKVITNEQEERRKDRERERESKKKTDGNQAVGEFCLDKAGEWTSVALGKPQFPQLSPRLTGVPVTGAREQHRALTTAWQGKLVSTQINAHFEMAVGAVKQTGKML